MIYDLTAKDSDGVEIRLDRFKGRWLVIYFYPKDDTPGCTTEAKEFTALHHQFLSEGCDVVGVSKDSCESHKKFIAKYNLGILLLSDKEGVLHNRLDVKNRSTFLFDPSGKLVKEWRGVNPKGHAEQVLNTLKELKNSFKNNSTDVN